MNGEQYAGIVGVFTKEALYVSPSSLLQTLLHLHRPPHPPHPALPSPNPRVRTCAALPSVLTTTSPYLSRPFSCHSASLGIGPNAAKMSAWWVGSYVAGTDGTKTFFLLVL